MGRGGEGHSVPGLQPWSRESAGKGTWGRTGEACTLLILQQFKAERFCHLGETATTAMISSHPFHVLVQRA